MAEYLTTDIELTLVADAIRAKGGTSAALAYPTEFVAAISAIPTGAAYAIMTSGDIAYAANSGWRGSAPSEEVLIWESVTDGWNTNTTMTDSDISDAVALGWR